MTKFILVAGMLMSFGLSADTMTNPKTGEVWALTDNGAYNADNSKLIKNGDKYYGADGRIYLRQGDTLMQIDGPRQEQMGQPQQLQIQIQIQITAPPVTTAPFIGQIPFITPMHHYHPHRPHPK
jgi:hypothetical protein